MLALISFIQSCLPMKALHISHTSRARKHSSSFGESKHRTSGDYRDWGRLQRLGETAETGGDQWKLQRQGKTSGDCRD